MIAQVVVIVAATLIAGAVGWIMHRLETQGRDLAIIRDQLIPASGQPLRAIVAEHGVAIARIQEHIGINDRSRT